MPSWILAGLGSFGSSLIGSVIGKITDYVIERVLEDPGVADLHELKNTLSRTQRTIGRVENMWIKDEDTKKRLKELLMKLKDTVYDADDLLDEIQFRVLKQQIEQQGAQGYEASNQSSFSFDLPPSKRRKLYDRVGRLFGREDDVDRVRENQSKLDEYTTEIKHFIDNLHDDEKQMITSVVPRTTTSFPIETQVFGREKQLNDLLERLMKSADGSGSSNSSISTLTIFGIGGVGKTTLAQHAYHHEKVKDYFHHKVWVCVSDDFNVERLTKEIMASLTRKKCDLNNFNTLQEEVMDKLTSKRFLLVLDDVWNEDSQEWKRFCAPLTHGEPGSKILVTTRSKKIAEMVGNPIPLYGLDNASYWEFFKTCAFGSEYAGEFPQLEAIAGMIVGRLKGLPLAARTVGGLLKARMNEKDWRNIAGSEIWQLQHDENGVLPVLQLSYQCLPPHLKRCFVFCAMFPKDHWFDKEDLVQLWMAEGYVDQDNMKDNMTLEAVGSDYFRELVNRSFFQEAPWGSTYVMHDLIHDLAQFISKGEFCRIDESKEIPNTTRHLSATLTDGTKLMELSCYDKLRTLMINSKSYCFSFGVESPLFIQFEKLKNIRVLILRNCGLRELPEKIGGLIHLRYLDISYNRYIKRLPESLCGLYNLRVLDLWFCELESLPHGMSKLINLMHLNAKDEIISEINDVGKLTSLQGLSSFKVLKDQGHEVAQLGSLKQLHGRLQITNLENVESKQEASKANLNNKQYLEKLVLEWTSDDGNELIMSKEVLEGLQPHQALKRLTIRGYTGVRSPSWLQAQLLANLITLRLKNCKAWEDISCIGQLPNLKKLYVKGMPAVKQISHGLSTESKFLPNLEELGLENMVALEELPSLGQRPCLKVLRIDQMSTMTKVGHGFFGYRDQGKCFPCLEELRFNGMPKWEEWSWADGRELFPCLRKLQIERCPKLKRLPPLPPSLKSLSLCRVGLTEVPRLWEEIDGGSSSMIVSELKIYSLEEIKLVDIPECEELPCLGQLPSLKVLRIEGMPTVKKVGDGFFSSRDESKCFPSLEELTFRNMLEWEEWSWADGRQLFPCLRKFEIVQCQRLKRLPPLPPSLESLSLCRVESIEVPRLWEEIDGSSSMTVPEYGLPCLGQLPSLNVLRIEGMPTVKKVGDGFFGSRDQGKCFPSLEELAFIDMPEWEEWSWTDGRQLFPCLRKLEIERCPKLKRLPPLPPPLKSLSLCEVGLTEVPRLWEEIDGSSSSMIVSELKIYSLEEIKLVDIPECEELPCLGQLPSLKVLGIQKMPAVKKVGDGFFGSRDHGKCFPSLEELAFIDMPEWEEWSWTDGRQLFPCLRKLEIERCPKLKRLPPLPPPLKSLSLCEVGLTEVPRLWVEIDGRSSSMIVSELKIYSLEEIKLVDIPECEELPCLGQLPSLKVFRIQKMPAVKKVGGGFFGSRDQGKCFPSLEELTFRDMLEWEEWSWADGRQLFPCLRELQIVQCPRLKRMPPLPPLLQTLNLHEVGLTELPGLWEGIDGSSNSMTAGFTEFSLERVKLMDIPECERLPCLGRLPSLKVLHIEGMPTVKKVGDGFFGSRYQDKCFPSLEELTFRDMPEWEEWSWADDRQLFPCLRELEIERCPKLKRLPPLPPSLESLLLSQVGSTEVPRLWEEIDGSSSMTVPEYGLPCLGQLPSLKVLRIEGMPTVKKVGDGFFGSRDQGICFPSLEELTFIVLPEWEEWSWADDRQLFPCLRELEIILCPRLKRLPPLPPPLQTLHLHEVGLTELPGLWEGIHRGGNLITASLSTLRIRNCPNLRNLAEGLLSHSLPNIRDIEIAECAELVWLPVKEFKELTSLAKLSIRSCPKLLSMTRDGDDDILLPPSIKELVLSDCGNLGKLLPGCLHNLTSLTRLEIGDCPSIESLPETSLLHLKRLEYLKIWKCGELRSIDGLRVLESLRELTIKLCPKLLLHEGNEQVEGSSVTELCIDDTALFKLSLLRRTLPSVRALTISNFPRATMSGEEEQLLRSLTALGSLEFEDCENLQSLPRELHALSSLRLLKIIRCPKIQSLPEKGLPTSLRNLIFFACHPMLTEQLQKHLDEMKSSGRFLDVDQSDILRSKE